MRKEDKQLLVEELTQQLRETGNFYLADISELSSNDTNDLRKLCYEKGIKLQVVKNTLIHKALEEMDFQDKGIFDILKGPSSIMFSESVNAPARLIKDFRKKFDKPVLKAAFVQESLYIGDENLETLTNLKSKEELIGDVIGLLQSPIRNVISGLQSSGSKIAGILKTLAEKEEK